ncbi:MAG: glutamate mutase L [Chloroflexi bacterium]|nr:glutamate mutase L [Chloroflexota bacterium]
MTATDGNLREQERASEALQASHSFLVADCGHSVTTVTLFDVVEGAYRFIARGSALTTIGDPWFDVARGVQQAIAQIMEITGRTLVNEQGTLIRPTRSDGAGVDYFGVLVSAAEPLKALLVGLLEDVSLASARHALETIYALEVDSFSLADSRSQQTQVDALLARQPDLVLVAGGTDGSNDPRLMKLVETVSLAVGMQDGYQRPVVLYAGNNRLRPKVNEALGNLTSLHVAENVRPALEVERLGDAIRMIGEMYETRKINTVPGLDEILSWSSYPPMPTAHAFGGIIEYFAALYRGRVLGLDVGSDSVTFVSAEPEKLRLFVRSDLGVGHPVANLLNKIEPTAILDWSISELTPAQLRDFLLNKALRPQTVPLTEDELLVEQAVVRQVIRCAANDALKSWGLSTQGKLPPFKLLLLRGSALTGVARLGQAVLMVLDALQPTGIFPLAIDRHGVLPSLGYLAPYDSLLTVQVLEGGVLDDIGWVIAPVGRAQPGQAVMNVRVDSPSLGVLEIDVAYGTLEVLPLAPGQTAELTLKPTRRFDLGYGPGQGRKIKIHGGAVGLVIDARGRPLELPRDAETRRNLLRQWLLYVGG